MGQGGHRGAECRDQPGGSGDGGVQAGDHLLHGGPGLQPQAPPHRPGLQGHWGQGRFVYPARYFTQPQYDEA